MEYITGIIVAVISALGVVATTLIQTISANKKDKMESLLNDIRIALKNESLSRCKVDLINALGKVVNGYQPTEEERRVLYEEKEEYNKLGGNSYVNDLFERLQREGKL